MSLKGTLAPTQDRFRLTVAITRGDDCAKILQRMMSGTTCVYDDEAKARVGYSQLMYEMRRVTGLFRAEGEANKELAWGTIILIDQHAKAIVDVAVI